MGVAGVGVGEQMIREVGRGGGVDERALRCARVSGSAPARADELGEMGVRAGAGARRRARGAVELSQLLRSDLAFDP